MNLWIGNSPGEKKKKKRKKDCFLPPVLWTRRPWKNSHMRRDLHINETHETEVTNNRFIQNISKCVVGNTYTPNQNWVRMSIPTKQGRPNMFTLAVVGCMLNFRNVLYETSCGFCDIVVLAVVGCMLNFINVLWDIMWFLQHCHPGYTLWDLYASYGFSRIFIWKCILNISGCTLRGKNVYLWTVEWNNFFFPNRMETMLLPRIVRLGKTLWSPRAKWLQLNLAQQQNH